MNKFIRLKTTDGEILVNPEYLHFVIQKDGVTRIQGRTGPADLNVDIEQSVEEVMARINGDSKPTDYPNVAPGGLKLAWTTYSDGETAAAVVRHELRIARKIAAYHLACAEHLHRLLVGMEGV